jgi:hypothetical protein
MCNPNETDRGKYTEFIGGKKRGIILAVGGCAEKEYKNNRAALVIH